MQVTIEYEAQIKRAVGTGRESFDVSEGCSLPELIQQAVDQHPESLANLIFDEAGHISSTILIFVNNQQVRDFDTVELAEQSVVTLLSPISGG